MLACAGIALMLALFPGAGSALRALDILVTLALVGLALATAFLAPRVRNGWALDALILIVVIMACVGAARVPTGEAQVIAGLGLSLFVVFAAYFRPRQRFLGLLALTIIGYTTAAIVNPVMSNPAAFIAVLAVIVGVSAMVNFQAVRMQELVLHDPLTGALNRRGLEFHAPQIAASAARSGVTVTVGLIDLDDFKGFNDANGHAAGDDLLIDTAEAWRAAARTSDLIVRYGGDEFAVVLVGMGPDDATALASRVKSQTHRSWSVGFSAWSPDEDVYDALARADAAMFSAKPEG